MPLTRQKILILHTGGTFAMTWSAAGNHIISDSEYLNDLTHKVPEILDIADVKVEVLCNVDSSDIGLPQWELIANTILARWVQFDGFVIIHGTDTLAFTASALSFFLSRLTKTIVLTGSQRPLSERRNDARANLIDSVELACTGIPEVLLCFDGLVHRGVRATKKSNEHLHAFESPNAPVLAEFGVHFRTKKSQMKPHFLTSERAAPLLDCRANCNIASLTALPGMSLSQKICETLTEEFQGLIIVAFGSGNLSLQENGFLRLAEIAFAKKIPLVMASQCRTGSVQLNAYESGQNYAQLGVMSAFDMTIEAASVKLMVLLGRQIAFEDRHSFFYQPLASELSLNAIGEEEG
jgi:L-asparaginase